MFIAIYRNDIVLQIKLGILLRFEPGSPAILYRSFRNNHSAVGERGQLKAGTQKYP
jgi:hypothetical protein